MGYPFEADLYNRSIMVSRQNKHRIHISTPFWLNFIENHLHFLPMPKITFNFYSFASISPKSLFVHSVNIMTMRSIIINLTNTLETSSFTVTDIYTTSRSIFVDNINPKILSPNQTLQIKIYFCATEIGFDTALVFIRTTLGLIPYSISFRVVATSVDLSSPNIFHQSTHNSRNISIKIPQIVSNRQLSILYDTQIFHSQKSSANEKHIRLSPINLKHGNYVSFVHMVTPKATRTSPIFIFCSNKYIMPSLPIIILDTVTTPDGKSEADIQIVNPSTLNIVINSISLAKDAPSNLQLHIPLHQVTCARYTSTVIGKVFLHGTRQGEIETNLIVVYESMDSSKSAHTIEIPIRGYVEYGSFDPNETVIDHLQNCAETHSIHFVNHFNVPVAVLTAQTDSLYIRVIDFVPFIVMPGEKSEDIKIKFYSKKQILLPLNEANLRVETNATNHQIPIRSFTGQISISDDLENYIPQNSLFRSLGKIFVGTTTNFTFYIKNPNPTDFIMTDFNATPGIIVNGFWQGDSSSPLREHKMAPFSAEEINLFITFNNIKVSKPRNDTISIGSGSSSIQFHLTWTPLPGTFIIRTTLPRNIRFGRYYTAEIFVNSTFSVSTKLRSITSQIAAININYTDPFLRPGILTPCGNFSFLLDSSLFLKTKIYPLFNSSYEWTEHRKMWDSLWLIGMNSEIPIILHFKGNMNFRVSLPVTIESHHFNDVVLEGGTILLKHKYNFFTKYRNTLECPVEFRMNNSEGSVIVAQPNEEFEFPIVIIPDRPSQSFFRIPITNNATHPFFIHIHAKVVTPNLALIGFDDSYISSLEFESENDFRSGNWKKTVLLKNKGALNVSIGEIETSSNLFAVTSDCPNLLSSGDSCHIDVSVILMYLRKQKEESELTVKIADFWNISCPLKVRLGSKAMNGLKKVQIVNTFLVTVLALMLPVKDIIVSVKNSLKLQKDIKNRINSLDAECEELSMSKKSSIGTQVIFLKVDLGGGTWVPAQTEVKASISEEADFELEQLLNSLC